MKQLIVLTVDDETPKCLQCDNVCLSDEFCRDSCGAEHGWSAYRRTIREEQYEKR